MEVFNSSKLYGLAYHSINQSGRGHEIDRYIYQDGEGLGSFFGNLFRKSLPFLGKAIKGAAQILKPHAETAATELINKAANQSVKEIQKAIHRPHKRKRQI